MIKEIAAELRISETWVESHIARIINKGVPINLIPYQIVRLYKMGLTHQEIADRCNIPIHRVSMKISRLIRTLRLEQRPHWRKLAR